MPEKIRKTIELPSDKSKVEIRRLSAWDFALSGKIPDIFGKLQGGTDKLQLMSDLPRAEIEWLIRLVCSAITLQPGKKIVDKRPAEAAADEISFLELADADQELLISEVFKLVMGGSGPVPEKFP